MRMMRKPRLVSVPNRRFCMCPLGRFGLCSPSRMTAAYEPTVPAGRLDHVALAHNGVAFSCVVSVQASPGHYL